MELSEQELFEGLSVVFQFSGDQPKFGDLFEIVGFVNPNFPPSGKFKFSELASLQFSQVDDYFGIRTTSGIGDDVCIWLYPLVDGEIVEHHPGPYSGIEITYNVLRNPISRAAHFFKVIRSFELALKEAPSENIVILKTKCHAIVEYWASKGLEVGSNEALGLDY